MFLMKRQQGNANAKTALLIGRPAPDVEMDLLGGGAQSLRKL
eukprot:gene12813-29330_t